MPDMVQLVRSIARLPEPVRHLGMFLACTGARAHEACALTWRRVRFPASADEWRVVAAPPGPPGRVTLPGGALEFTAGSVLERALYGALNYFCSRAGRVPSSRDRVFVTPSAQPWQRGLLGSAFSRWGEADFERPSPDGIRFQVARSLGLQYGERIDPAEALRAVERAVEGLKARAETPPVVDGDEIAQLKRMCEAAGLTLSAFAVELGINGGTLNTWLRGYVRPSPEAWARVKARLKEISRNTE